MASIFRQQFTTAGENGKRIHKRSQHWYIDYKTGEGTRRRVRAYKDKTATLQLAAKLEKEGELADSGIIDKYKEHRKRPLTEHINDFKNSLVAKGNTAKHVDVQTKRIESVFEGCGFRTWQDISASRIEKAISGLRKSVEVVKDGVKIAKDLGAVSAKTQGYYLKAIQQFCRWMVQDGRAAESPAEHLKAKKSVSAKRRALEVDEVRKLLEHVQGAGNSFGMSGAERALLYRLAVETGLRVSELKSLTADSFDLTAKTVTVAAAYAKNRLEAVLPLREETAAAIKEFLRLKVSGAGAFNMPHVCSISRMFRKDLEAVEIASADAGSGKLDFHSLRHTFGTMLAACGVHPKTAQDLMRHSDINLTMSRYTHTLRGQESEAVESLPDLSLPNKQSQKATGTDNSAVDGTYKPAYKKLAKNAYSGYDKPATVGTNQTADKQGIKQMDNIDNALIEQQLGNEEQELALAGTAEEPIGPGRDRTFDQWIMSPLLYR